VAASLLCCESFSVSNMPVPVGVEGILVEGYKWDRGSVCVCVSALRTRSPHIQTDRVDKVFGVVCSESLL